MIHSSCLASDGMLELKKMLCSITMHNSWSNWWLCSYLKFTAKKIQRCVLYL